MFDGAKRWTQVIGVIPLASLLSPLRLRNLLDEATRHMLSQSDIPSTPVQRSSKSPCENQKVFDDCPLPNALPSSSSD